MSETNRASIVTGAQTTETYRFAASELARYLQTLSGAEIKIISDTEIGALPRQEALIAVGGPDVNKTTKESAAALGLNFNGLKPEGVAGQRQYDDDAGEAGHHHQQRRGDGQQGEGDDDRDAVARLAGQRQVDRLGPRR